MGQERYCLSKIEEGGVLENDEIEHKREVGGTKSRRDTTQRSDEVDPGDELPEGDETH